MNRVIGACVLGALAVGCGGADDESGSPDPVEEPAGTWQDLVTGEWQLDAGTEDYICVRETLTEDVYVGGFEAISPLGTHHTVVTVRDESDVPDGVAQCSEEGELGGGNGSSPGSGLSARLIHGSGVGTNAIEYPDGVAVKLAAGSQVRVNMHLYNTSDESLSGTSGTRVKIVDEADVEHEGEAVLIGPFHINLPPGEETDVEGSCAMPGETTIFAVQPHMHRLGTHMRVVADSTIEGETKLFDQAFDFDSQLVYEAGPVTMAEGDGLRVACTYKNTTTDVVRFGQSTDDEMCLAAVYRYPRVGNGVVCPALPIK